jgi:hypothetical protein
MSLERRSVSLGLTGHFTDVASQLRGQCALPADSGTSETPENRVSAEQRHSKPGVGVDSIGSLRKKGHTLFSQNHIRDGP